MKKGRVLDGCFLLIGQQLLSAQQYFQVKYQVPVIIIFLIYLDPDLQKAFYKIQTVDIKTVHDLFYYLLLDEVFVRLLAFYPLIHTFLQL